MFSLVIADDELHQRQGLANYIHWESLGFALKGCFADGAELMDYLKEHHVDVIFTDINMSPVSGLDIAQYVHKNRPETSVVFISGYKEFEFAQKALEYNVHGYIIKPARIEDICRVFQELAVNLAETERPSEEALEVMRRHFLDDLLFGYRMDGDEIVQKLADLRLPAGTESPAAVLSFKVENPEEPEKSGPGRDTPRLRRELNQAVRQAALPHFAATVYNHGGRCAAVLLGSMSMGDEAWQRETQRWTEGCVQAARQQFGLMLSEPRTETFRGLCALNQAYQSQDNQPTPAALRLAFPKGEPLGKSMEGLDSVTDMTLQKARRYIDENFCKDISLDEVADYVHLSPIYFSRFFKQKTGQNFINYLVSLRMRHAMELLKGGEYKVYEVSERVGYKSVKYFSRVFKQATGYSPADYARLSNVFVE